MLIPERPERGVEIEANGVLLEYLCKGSFLMQWFYDDGCHQEKEQGQLLLTMVFKVSVAIGLRTMQKRKRGQYQNSSLSGYLQWF